MGRQSQEPISTNQVHGRPLAGPFSLCNDLITPGASLRDPTLIPAGLSLCDSFSERFDLE